MAREIELKLSIDPQQAAAFKALPLLAESGAAVCQRLNNQYFDTPDRLLAQHRVGLRIREQGERYIQTLKTRGSSHGGLHQRNEWEWDLEAPELDYDLLATADWPQALQESEAQRRIVPAFSTDFERSTWMLRPVSTSGEQALIELVLDRGQVSATPVGGAVVTTALCELELELKQGSAADLYQVAMSLAESVPVLLSDISKAERGYRLLGAMDERPEAPLAPAEPNSVESFAALAQGALTRASRGLDGWRGSQGLGQEEGRDWPGAETAAAACLELQALLQCFEELLPLAAELQAPLAQLCQGLERALGWRRLQSRLADTAAQAWAAAQAPIAARGLDALLSDPATGRALLGYGALLQRL
uniref:CYTH domain-containing protein n=1 Tax=Marinobacterium profundum TaxID=1714300 RepID=UPI00082CE898|nr:CYTH domain-containing protein [Marinobacterium profundum]